MQNIINIKTNTLVNAEIDHLKVCINFSNPFKALTKRNTLVTLRTLKTLII